MVENYSEDSIRTLDWQEHIRLRPGMYIGKLGDGSAPDDGIYILDPELSEQERMELMVEQNNDYLDDERCNLNIQLSRPILLIADIGRWDGRYPGYAEIKSGNIRDCLYSEMDYSTWYVDRLGDLRCDAVHHDGTNHYLYRAYKENVSEAQIVLYLPFPWSATHTSET